LARSSSSDEYIGHFEKAYGIFVMEENIRRINEDGLSPAVQFVIAASRHLASATAALLGSPPSPKALEDSRLAVEIAIKAVLILKFGYTDSMLQKQFRHGLGLLRDELLKVKPDLDFTEADLAVYPEISARYGDIAEDRDRLWKGYALAVSIVATGFEIIQDEMLG